MRKTLSLTALVALFIASGCQPRALTLEEIEAANKSHLKDSHDFISQSFELYVSENAERKKYCIEQYLSFQLEQNAYFDSSAARMVYFILKRPPDTTRYESSLYWSPDTNYVTSDRALMPPDSPFSFGIKKMENTIQKEIAPILDSIKQ